MKVVGKQLIFLLKYLAVYILVVLKCFILCGRPSVGGVFRLSVPFVGRNEIVGILGEKHVKMKNMGINKTMFT